jgi:hypothetical protein
MTEFAEAQRINDWQGIRQAMRKRFRNLDQAQKEETEDSLRTWCMSCSVTPNLGLQSYLDSFGPRFNRCLEAGTVSLSHKGFYLAKGLSKQRLNKVLNKYELTISQPEDFRFEVIEPFLNKIASREAEIETFNPAFAKKNAAKSTNAEPNGALTATTAQDMFRAPQLNPNVVTQRKTVPMTVRPKGERGVQMPPGHEPTQGEIDDLADKFSRIKLNGANLFLEPQEPREAELLAYPDICEEINRTLAQITIPQNSAPMMLRTQFPNPPRAPGPYVPSSFLPRNPAT